METNQPEGIINRIKNLELNQPLKSEEISKVESELNIKLALDFKEINNICSYEFIGLFDFLNFGLTNNQSVIAETQYYRENHNLPNNYLVLAEDDVYFVLLKIVSPQKSEVIWCDYEDFFNLCEGKEMKYSPTIFPSFTDFYEYLLDEEEKMRAEE